MWSGAARSTPINDKTDRKKPSAWRKGNRKTRRSVNAVSIAQSENFFGAPGRPDGDGRHASVASAESHSVTSPRWTKACSYADQFPTRYFVLYFGWTFDLMSRSCTRSGHRGQRANSCLVAAGRVVHQRPKVATHGGSPLEPAGDGVPGQPFDPGSRRQTDPLDAQRDDTVERRSAMLEAVIGRAFRRRERLSAPDAPVATPFPGCGSVESVADDACGLDVSVQRTRGVETAWFLHCAGLVDESTEALTCRPKL